MFTLLWGGTLCQNDGKALITPLSIVAVPLPAPKPMVISLLEEGEEPWIPDVGSPEVVAGDVSPAPLPAPKPMVISLLEEGEEPWIPDVGIPEAVAGDVSP
ncbi:UNVERIFIED_CONTAM: hypothetical protein H355_003970, partial [Colinus virginianus]